MLIRMPIFSLLLVAMFWVAGGCGSNDSDHDAAISDTTSKPDLPPDEPFGRACTNIGAPCPDKDPQGASLICVSPIGSAPGKGFCTRECTDKLGPECYDVPNGLWAECLLSSAASDAGPQQTYCAFLCQSPDGNWACPPTLHCGEAVEGQAVCVP